MIIRTISMALACALIVPPSFVAANELPPAWLHEGPVSQLDGQTDDLVTGGLGAEAMFGSPPGYVDPDHPTAVELRRASLFFKASKGQGFGRIYGPNVDQKTGEIYRDNGKIAGDEILAFNDDGSGRQNVANVDAGGLPASTTAEHGPVVEELAKAGFFPVGGVLIGTVAYQCYSAILGRRLDAATMQTGGADFAQFQEGKPVQMPALGRGPLQFLDYLIHQPDSRRPTTWRRRTGPDPAA